MKTLLNHLCIVTSSLHTKSVLYVFSNIKAVPAGVSRGVKKLMKAKVPNMGNYDDVSEYLMK